LSVVCYLLSEPETGVPNPIVALDIGTTKVCTLIAEPTAEDGRLRIIGVSTVRSRGMKRGVVVNVDEATLAITESVEMAERTAGVSATGAYVGVAGDHIASLNSRGVVAVSHSGRAVTKEDVARALDAARAIAIPHNREIIHILPRDYTLDGVTGVREPLGMQGFRLEVEAHIVTAAIPSLHNLIKCVESAGLEVIDMVLQPLAASEAVLSQEERESGVVLADVGGGTTDIAIFVDGSIWHSQVLPLGGYYLTNDLAIGLRAPFSVAEELKINHGHALPEMIAEDEQVNVAAFGDQPAQPVLRREVADILRARAEEIFDAIAKEIKRSGYEGLLPAGLVLTGGTAKLSGFKELGRERLGLPVRIGVPQDLEGLTDTISSPAYATSVGLLHWGWHHTRTMGHVNGKGPGWLGVFHRINEWVKGIFPY